MNWNCNYCGHRTEPVKEVKQDGDDWPAGRACRLCGKGEMVCRPMEVRLISPIEPSPAVTFVVQRSYDGEVWEDYFVGDMYSSKAEAVSVASEQHERYNLTRKFRVIRRVEKVEWEPKHD